MRVPAHPDGADPPARRREGTATARAAPPTRWWLWLPSAAMLLAGVYAATIVPILPQIERASHALMPASTRTDHEPELIRIAATREQLDQRVAALAFAQIAADPTVMTYARRSRTAVVRLICPTCPAGAMQADRLAGPSVDRKEWAAGRGVARGLARAVRSGTDAAVRTAMMPAFGVIGLPVLATTRIVDVVFVLRRAGDPAAAARGDGSKRPRASQSRDGMPGDAASERPFVHDAAARGGAIPLEVVASTLAPPGEWRRRSSNPGATLTRYVP